MGTNNNASSRLLNAASRSDQKEVELALKEGADPTHRDLFSGNTALHLAATRGDLKTIEQLIEYGAAIDDRGNNVHSTALGNAAIAGQLGATKLLLSLGAKLSEDELDVVDEVKAAGFSEIAELLLESVNK